jgi:hypothetical protein
VGLMPAIFAACRIRNTVASEIPLGADFVQGFATGAI